MILQAARSVRGLSLGHNGIMVNESNKGKGYGKAKMTKLDQLVKKEGAERMSLNAFGSNALVRNICSNMGYHEATITMMKYL